MWRIIGHTPRRPGARMRLCCGPATSLSGSSSVLPQQDLDERHANEEAVLGLPEVRRAGVRIHLLRDLVKAREGVHDDGVLPHDVHDGLVDDVLAARLLVLLRAVLEALLLDPRLVQHVHVRRHLLEVVHLGPLDPGAVEELLDVVAHLHHGGGHEDELHVVVVLGQQVGQRAHGAPVGQVAHHAHPHVVQPPQLPLDRVRVQQRLCGVLAGAVAGVDQRRIDGRRGLLRGSGVEMAEDDDVRVALNHPHGVFERFSLRGRRELASALCGQHRAAHLPHRRLEREAGTCGWLIE
mmetsp:Transcript_37204/g.80995  ORF Transcript_37204/g.80995 Transcript_37204/m.80995 type:complete len:294 (-) Transcript_37204:186-1067(-)